MSSRVNNPGVRVGRTHKKTVVGKLLFSGRNLSAAVFVYGSTVRLLRNAVRKDGAFRLSRSGVVSGLTQRLKFRKGIRQKKYVCFFRQFCADGLKTVV